MYADRSSGRRFNPGSLGVAVGINAALVGALLVAAPDILPLAPRPPLVPIDWHPELPPPPPPVEPTAKPSEQPVPTDTAPPPPQHPDVFETPSATDSGPVFAAGPSGAEDGVAGGTGTVVADPPLPPTPAPVIVAPGIDPRFADLLQPDYPAAERRAGNEGRVVVRVLIGTDGRVKEIERVSAASEAFWRATAEQARRRWRFTPGTRDGVPVEAWRTMALTFRMEDS